MGFWEFVNKNTPLFPAVEHLALAALSLETFIRDYCSHEHDHDGEGNNCSVCLQLNLARHVLDSLACIAAAVIAVSRARAKKPAKILSCFFFIPITLIYLKVKSNT
ncbi:MAG: hypothetical protein LBU16_01910 [Treponema sp.]|nr:hypothetical protein [Treponema sp.]